MSNTNSRIDITNFGGILCLKLTQVSSRLVRTRFNIPFDSVEPSAITLTLDIPLAPIQIALSYVMEQRGIYSLILDPSSVPVGTYSAELILTYPDFVVSKDLKVKVEA